MFKAALLIVAALIPPIAPLPTSLGTLSLLLYLKHLR